MIFDGGVVKSRKTVVIKQSSRQPTAATLLYTRRAFFHSERRVRFIVGVGGSRRADKLPLHRNLPPPLQAWEVKFDFAHTSHIYRGGAEERGGGVFIVS